MSLLTNYPVEHLIFEIVDPSDVEAFIEMDTLIWTSFLSKQKGFISKEVWINKAFPGQVQTILIWESLTDWKNIPTSELSAKDTEFKLAFGKPFKLVRAVHEENNHGIEQVYRHTL